MHRFDRVTSSLVPLLLDNVNTDQIIPARFLKRTDTEGWQSGLFADWKKDSQFVLNDARWAGSSLMLAGSNFGCGSSREHAAWALRDSGFRAIVAPSFADIFRENAIKNGLLPATVGAPQYDTLVAQLGSTSAMWTIDLPAQSLSCDDLRVGFEIDPFSKTCLIQGLDGLGYILEHEYAINAYEVFTTS